MTTPSNDRPRALHHAPPLEAFVRRITAIPDRKLQTVTVRAFFDSESDEALVGVLRELMTDIEVPGYRATYHAVLRFALARPTDLGYGRVEALYRTAVLHGNDPVRYLLLVSAPPRLVARPEHVPPDPTVRDVPLGTRKSMARSQDREVIGRMLFEVTPEVVTILLDNPKVSESDVVRITARRPTLPSVIALVAEHPQWSLQPEIQRAIVQNPYAPTSLAVAYAPLLLGQHLAEVSLDQALHPAVRAAAQAIRVWRAESRVGTVS